MKLYHASYTTVDAPDILHSRDYLDFGKGFYLTSMREQAEKYAERFRRRGREAWINIYEFTLSDEKWQVQRFEHYDAEWLKFVTDCRAGINDDTADLVIGGIADDKVIRTVDLYLAGEMTQERALGLLAFEKPNDQYCFRNQEIINHCLKFIESRQL